MLRPTWIRFRSMMSVLLSLLLTVRTWAHSRAALQLEVLALRHQRQVLQRTRPRRLQLAKADRWLWSLLSRIWTVRRRVGPPRLRVTLLVEGQLFTQEQIFRRELRARRQTQPDEGDEVMQ